MRLNRDAIQRMINIPQGSGSVGIGGEGGSLAGLATEAWVEFMVISKMTGDNREYRAAKEQLHRQANGYGNGYDAPRGVGCSCCDICAGLMCMDCLCGNGC